MISIDAFAEYLKLIHSDTQYAMVRAQRSQDAQAINSASRDFTLAVLVKRNIYLHLQHVATVTHIFIRIPTCSTLIS